MRYVRRIKATRRIAVALLIVFLQSFFSPWYTYALTTGPHQPEYISFTSPGSTDMVDLLTGDFSFSLPILEVPGPEGSFSLPLSYKAGVGPEQESSWVGLGWSLNAGAITRSINEFPDDANGESHVVTVQDLTGVRGWDASFLGVGLGWNSEYGHYGSISLLGLVNTSWSSHHTSVGIAGINVSDDGLQFNPMQFMGAMISLATAYIPMGDQAVSALGLTKQGALDAAIQGVFSVAGRGNTPNAPTAGYWEYSKSEKKKFYLVGTVREYRIWLDQTRNEKMFGTLYLGNAPVSSFTNPGLNADIHLKNGDAPETLYSFQSANNQGSASDINYQSHPSDDNKEFYEINNPAALAPDGFSVKAAGVAGTIRPYRLDVGAVSMPRQMTKHHDRLAPVRYLTNDASYKVPFVYNGQTSGHYYHHVGASSTVSSPTFYFGLNTILADPDPADNTSLTYDINDVVLKNQRIRSDLNTYKKVPQGNYIEWLSNDEIRSSMTYSSRFMDYFSGGTGSTVSTSSDRFLFRTSHPFGSQMIYTYTTSLGAVIPISQSDIGKFEVNDIVDIRLSVYDDQEGAENGATTTIVEVEDAQVSAVSSTPPYSVTISNSGLYPYYGEYANIELNLQKSPPSLTGIGGFCITAEDGTTYHFALPVYDYNQETETRDINDPTSKRSFIRRIAPFANTWLLTGITGSDFIDRDPYGMIDERDWGHWVKFNYGIHENEYHWSLPYAGYKQLPGGTHETKTEGMKQLVYLNSIETRSHVALFLKDNRADGKSALPSKYPLGLKEIALLSREHYNKIVTPTGQGGYGLPNLSNTTGDVLMSSDVSGNLRDFINNNCLKRVLFTYGYNLAQGTLNSDATGGGKLTLTNLSIRGKTDQKIVPDYKFEYANNPAYSEHHWDGFGIYNPGGTASAGTHSPSSTDSHGSSWSMTKVVTPLGSEISINYERDTYASVSGRTMSADGPSFDNQNFNVYYPSGFPIKRLTVSNPSSYFEVGDSVLIEGYANYECSPNPVTRTTTFSKGVNIVAIGSNYIDVDEEFMDLDCSLTSSGQYVHFDGQAGTVYKPLKHQKGGDIRVASIVMKDEFGNENKIRYLYSKENGLSSGVISKLPAYVHGPQHQSYYYLGYPQTPVLYSRVTMLSGKLTTDSDYTSRHVYEFETPHHSQYMLAQSIIKENELIRDTLGASDRLSVFWNKFEDRTSAIGRLKSIKIYDNDNVLHSSSSMVYTDQILNDGVDNHQGIYSDGVIMFDRVGHKATLGVKYHKINRTTFIQFPSVVRKVINSKDGFTSEATNLSWDPNTGRVLQKLEESPTGLYVKSVAIPAYTKYGDMGNRALNPAHRHMLSQQAATYTYRSDAYGNQISLLGAAAQLWKKDWNNYRVYDTGTQAYSDDSEEDDVWRKGAVYVWKGDYSRLRPDGTMTFSASDEYNFSGANPLWQYVGEPARYDHFSMTVESKDVNNVYAATKMGYDNRLVLASASNAEYNEIAFSSAEDKQPDKPFFGGEVGLGGGTILYKSKGQITQANTGDPNLSEAHTGDAIVAVTTGKTFVFKSTGLKINKRYRASVWTNSTNGRIYYRLNGGSDVLSSTPSAQIKSGPWYLLNLEFQTGGSFTSFEIGVKSATGEKVVFDDFRFQPVGAAMTCHVYDPLTFEYAESATETPRYEYILDNDNLATKYEYNERGMLKNVYRESVRTGVQYNGMKKVATYSDDFRRFHVNQ